jgi:hypothetical protein
MTDAQMLQKVEAVYATMVIVNDFLGRRWDILEAALSTLKEVIAELRRRIELEEHT